MKPTFKPSVLVLTLLMGALIFVSSCFKQENIKTSLDRTASLEKSIDLADSLRYMHGFSLLKINEDGTGEFVNPFTIDSKPNNKFSFTSDQYNDSSIIRYQQDGDDTTYVYKRVINKDGLIIKTISKVTPSGVVSENFESVDIVLTAGQKGGCINKKYLGFLLFPIVISTHSTPRVFNGGIPDEGRVHCCECLTREACKEEAMKLGCPNGYVIQIDRDPTVHDGKYCYNYYCNYDVI